VILVVVGVVLLQTQSLRSPVVASGRSGEGSSWGPADAKVTIMAFSDFNCSHCAAFALNQGRQLRAEYESTGLVRFEFRSFLISGAVSANAANAALCAADQGRFWDYHDTLFSQQGLSASPFDKSLLKQYAGQLGLDSSSFNVCVDRDAHLQEVYQDNSLGRSKGVNATPTFFINGEKVEGAVPYSRMKATIDAIVASGG
jgi:protein-disulfide isomerase